MDIFESIALTIALGGLLLVIFEIVLKLPIAFLEMAQDAGRFAREPVSEDADRGRPIETEIEPPAPVIMSDALFAA